MKVKVISRSTEEFTRERSQDLQRVFRNFDPNLRTQEKAVEYVRAVNSAKLEKIFARPFIGAMDGHIDAVSCMAKNPNHLKGIFSGSMDGDIRLWDMASRRTVRQFPGHQGAVRGLTSSTDGRILVSCGTDCTVRLWKVPVTSIFESDDSSSYSSEPLAVYVWKNAFWSVDHQWDGDQFATAGAQVDIWDCNRSEPIRSFEWGNDTVISVRFNPGEPNILATSASDRSIMLYDLRLSSPVRKLIKSAETLTQETFQSKTVHVKFQLQKECLFGQQFLLVGDDPMFGLWNPENAIPLNWSEEHIWIVELDIPIGKSIRFKFILKETTGEVVWQPGPDRILQIWDTKNKIIVSEDWENAEVQNITEEEPMVSSVITDEKPNMELIVSDNITWAVEEPMGNTNKEMIVIEEPMGNTNKEMIVMDNITYPGEEPKANVNKDSIITEKGIYPKEEIIVAENILGDDGVAVTEEKLICMTDTDSFVNQEGEPVLIPGLSPFPSPTTGEAVPNDGENGNVVDSSNEAVEAEEHNSPEVTV